MNITIVNNEFLIGNDTTYGELMKILRSRPEAAKVAEVERKEKEREKQEARMQEIFGENYDAPAVSDVAGPEVLKREKRRPGAIQLRTEVPCIGKIRIGAGGTCEVFSNGYAIYDNGDRKTVLWVPDCSSFTYYFGQLRGNEKQYMMEKDELTEDILGALPWYNALMLAGENQIEHNLDHPKSAGTDNDSDEPEEWEVKHAFRWAGGTHSDSPEEACLKKEEAEERRKVLTDKQREVYILYYEKGYNQCEIADRLGITQQSVSDRLDGVVKKLRAHGKNFL